MSCSFSDSLVSSESVLIKTQGTLKSAPLFSFATWFSLSPLEPPRTDTFAALLFDLKLFARNNIPGAGAAGFASDFVVFSFGSKGNLEVEGCCWGVGIGGSLGATVMSIFWRGDVWSTVRDGWGVDDWRRPLPFAGAVETSRTRCLDFRKHWNRSLDVLRPACFGEESRM